MRRSSILVMLCFSAILLLAFSVLNPTGRAVSLEATVDIKPDTLNVNMRGQWITAYIILPEGYNATDIDQSTILLDDLYKAEWTKTVDAHTAMAKFNASEVTDYLLWKLYHMGLERTTIELTVSGQLEHGSQFVGADTITIVNNIRR